MARTAQRTCPFCEATCGVSLEIEEDRIVTVRGDDRDPFSRGYICPKAYGLKGLYEDPDRLRRPVRRVGEGWEEISWEEAYADVARNLLAVRDEHGNDAIGMYTGNPVVHDLGSVLYRPVLARALGSKNLFNSAAIDTLPKIVQTGLMFGRQFPLGVPVPDIDRTSYLLIVGANPIVSHGSLMTTPDMPRRLEEVQGRGGRIVVIDPRRTETARIADEHHFIRPGADAAFLLSLVHVMFAEGLVRLQRAEGMVEGLAEVRAVASGFPPEAVADYCGISADDIRRLAREFCAAPSAACYGRLGTCVQEFGLLASWGCDLVNILSGNLDREGGVMFTTPAAPVDAALPRGKGFEIARWRSRVSGQPEVAGLIPSNAMCEEMLTPGPGQVRAMILLATNATVSAANSARLTEAFAGLDYLVCIDFYINETTRLANVILPPPSYVEHSGYELALYLLSVRDVAKWYSEAVPPPQGAQQSWQILLTLSAHLLGMGGAPLQMMDDFVLRQYAQAVAESGRYPGLTEEEIIEKVGAGQGPERILDMLLRVGPYGDGFGRKPGGLTLQKVREHPHGIDLGALKPHLADVINTVSGKIELAPEPMLADLSRLRAAMAAPRPDLVLIGRRDLRSCNSFMHNVRALVKGRDRCTLQMSSRDAARVGVASGDRVRLTSRTGGVLVPVEVTDDLMPGVVSLPHGWGHDAPGARLSVAAEHAGVNTNLLTDDRAYDVATGTTMFNGIPVRLERAPA
ncbi:MAG TPA: molybdopterin oxidoreductase family protein [Candidatus Limnocylindrales bacterium]|nr:molybdopterin oxidoreductase family protein [Candidatus Limnocylindrales bacterium]